jgi:hypothetical protein
MIRIFHRLLVGTGYAEEEVFSDYGGGGDWLCNPCRLDCTLEKFYT